MIVDVTNFIYRAKIEYFINWFWSIEEKVLEFMRLNVAQNGDREESELFRDIPVRLHIQIIYSSVIISLWANSVMPLLVYGR